MEEKEEDIFTDKFAKKSDTNTKDQDDLKPKDEVHDVSIGSDRPEKTEGEGNDDDWEIPDINEKGQKKRRKKKGIIIAIIIGLIVGGIGFAIQSNIIK